MKEFGLRRLRLTTGKLGKSREDVPSVIRDVGGLQYGGHEIELFNRFEDFKRDWFDYWYENHILIEGHVLRGALRIVNVHEYLYYFKATRSVARRRTYHNCPLFLSNDHSIALGFICEYGPFTPLDFCMSFGAKYAHLKRTARRLLYDLYNYGKIGRMGRRGQKPLYHVIEKLPYKFDISNVSEKEAKEWLFLKCLSIYGPSTLKDIAHWVGWTLTETREIANALLAKKSIIIVSVQNSRGTHYLRAEDLSFLDSLKSDLPDHSFVRILFNDDAFLLGYYKRLRDYFGYDWKYPQLSEGIVWRAAILCGRNLIGEATVDMSANSRLFKIKRLVLRKESATSETSSRIEREFVRHAKFQNKTLEFDRAKTLVLP